MLIFVPSVSAEIYRVGVNANILLKYNDDNIKLIMFLECNKQLYIYLITILYDRSIIYTIDCNANHFFWGSV